ncbi:MAG TPA: ABC transporter ATP-binding protein [Spirochaetia bacterium]|nr:ABC transporter ATP-binding protein [Spirochaetia bacterium]
MKEKNTSGLSHQLLPLLRCLAYMDPYRIPVAGGVLSLLLSSLLNLAIPWSIRIIIDRGISGGDLVVVLTGAGAIVAVSLIGALMTYLQGYLSARVSQGVAYDLRNRIYEKIHRLSFSYHDNAQTAQLLTRATSDVDQIRSLISTGVVQVLSAVFMLSGSLFLLFLMSWRLSLVIIPCVFLVLFVFSFFSRRGKPLFEAVQQGLAALNTRLDENIVGIRLVKAFTREDYELDRFRRANLELRNRYIRASRLFSMAIPLIFAIANLTTLVVIWTGGYAVIAGDLSIGELVAFQSYLMMSMFPVIMMGMLAMSVSHASAGAARVFELLDLSSEVIEPPDAVELPPVEGHLVFEDVTFRYFKGGEAVLDGVSFEAMPGQTVALLGATGSGKSTVINLIPRFYDVSGGRITIDGFDVRKVTLKSLRSQIGIALQEVTLFGGTIRENIAYGRPEASDREVEEAARTADIHDFVESLPGGYATPVGERGVTLSGGQKQRIAIARALLIDPRILILDDSLSSVDYSTESKIQGALERLRGHRLCLVIAQRISTVRSADLILVLDKGRVAASGSHGHLIRESPLYADIYYSQLQPDAEGTAAPGRGREP